MNNLINELIEKLNDMNDDYNLGSLTEENEIEMETKLKVMYEYGKQFGFGQSSAWTESMEKTLAVLKVSVKGINY